MRLSHRDFDALQRALLELYDFRDLDGFKRDVPAIFLRIIPSDYFLWNEFQFDALTKRATLAASVQSTPRAARDFASRLERHMPEHPFTNYFIQSGDRTALKLSDFLTLTQIRDAALYEEIYRPLELERELAGPVSGVRGPAAVSVGRRGRDFTERDRLIMNVLRPHFDQAHRNARLATDRLAARPKPLAAYDLTPREAEIAHWLAHGKTNPEIAIVLNLSVRTVEKHMEKILEKFGVENRTAAAVMVSYANGER